MFTLPSGSGVIRGLRISLDVLIETHREIYYNIFSQIAKKKCVVSVIGIYGISEMSPILLDDFFSKFIWPFLRNTEQESRWICWFEYS